MSIFWIVFVSVCLIAHIFIGCIFALHSAWAIGMPAHTRRTLQAKIKYAALVLSMIVGYPFWLIYAMVG